MRSWRSVFSIVAFAIVAGLVWTATATAQLQFLSSFGSEGSGNGQFGAISGVVVTSDGNIIVSDGSNHNLQVLKWDSSSQTVQYVSTYGSLGSSIGQFNRPNGLAVGPDGRIYVADNGNQRIQIFEFDAPGQNLQFVSAFGSSNTNNYFGDPTDTAVGPDGKVYVTVENGGQLKVLGWNSSGDTLKHLVTFGSGDNGSGNSDFFYPRGVAVGHTGFISVSDHVNNRIQGLKWNEQETALEYVSTFGSQGFGFAQLNRPSRITIGSDGRVYVADTDNNRILVLKLNPAGPVLEQIGEFGSYQQGGDGDEQLYKPGAVALGPGGKVYVADSGNDRLQVLGAPSMGLTPNSLDFGTLNIGNAVTDSIVVKNTGSALLSLSGASIVGTPDFTVNAVIADIIPGDSVYVRVTFTPVSNGYLSANLVLSHNTYGGATEVILSGSGAAPQLSITPVALDFGGIHLNALRSDSVLVKNTGLAPLSGGALSITGTASFTVIPANISLPVGDSIWVKTTFAPTSPGPQSAVLQIDNFAIENPVTIPLTGEGIAPAISLSSGHLDFGGVIVSISAVDSISIKNTGTTDLSISSHTVTGTDSSLFTIALFAVDLVPSDSAFVKVVFIPDSEGDKTATLQLTHNAPGTTSVITLRGSGHLVPVQLKLGSAFAAPGDTLRIFAVLDNPTTVKIRGLQFSATMDSHGSAHFVRAEDAADHPGFTVSAHTIGLSTRLVMLGLNGEVLDDTPSTQLFPLVYVIDPAAQLGTVVDLHLADIEIVDSLGVGMAHVEQDGQIQIGIRGDMNLNSYISVIDAVNLVRLIIGETEFPAAGTVAFNIADANVDGAINVVDVISQINSILGISTKTVVPVTSHPVSLYLGVPHISPSGVYAVPVMIDSDGLVSGLQMAFTYDPEFIEIGTPFLTGTQEGLLMNHHTKDGTMRIVAYSTQPGRGITSAPGPSLWLPVSLVEGITDVSTLTLSEVVIAGPQANILAVTLGASTAMVIKEASLPTAFSLSNATPNPFNPSTTIAYEVPEQTHVTLTIYNLLGQEVVRLMDQVQAAGRYEVAWHGVNSRGAGVASGVYLFRIVSGSGYTDTKRMTLLK